MGITHFDGVDAVTTLKKGGVEITATAAEINKIDGFTGVAADLNSIKGKPFDFTLTPSNAGGSNVCEVTIQAKDPTGTNVAHVVPLVVWLSDSATGAGLTGTAASGAVQAKAGSQDLATLTSKKALMVQTSATGAYVLSITDSAKTLYKVCVQSLAGETPTIATLITGNYGA